MATDDNPETNAHGRIGILQTITDPLRFFVLVVLIVEVFFGVVVYKLDEGVDRTFLIKWMIFIIFALILIVAGIAIWRPEALRGKRRQEQETKYSLFLGPAENLPDFDITVIDWDQANCFLICGNLKEQISLIRSRVGPSFRVKIPDKVLRKVSEEAIALELKDRKGNRWEVKSFYLYENLFPLSIAENIEKILQDYGEADQ